MSGKGWRTKEAKVPSGDLDDEVCQLILEYEISKLRLFRDREDDGS